MKPEVWKRIEKSDYQISNYGRVMNPKNNIMACTVNLKGYVVTSIEIGKIRKTVRVHRLVATAFLKNPKNKKTVNHLDGKKTNNYYLNLRWATNQENCIHAHRTGLCSNRKPGYLKKVTEKQVAAIKRLHRINPSFDRGLVISKLNISRHNLTDIITGRSYAWVA